MIVKFLMFEFRIVLFDWLAKPKLTNPSHYYLPIAGEQTGGFMPFREHLIQIQVIIHRQRTNINL